MLYFFGTLCLPLLGHSLVGGNNNTLKKTPNPQQPPMNQPIKIPATQTETEYFLDVFSCSNDVVFLTFSFTLISNISVMLPSF